MAKLTARPCPCRRREAAPLPYAQCCQPWHDGFANGVHAPNAQALMRSRYSAYALAGLPAFEPTMYAYLRATWQAGQAPDSLHTAGLLWTGLDLKQAEENGASASVEFVAFFKTNGKAARMHERSRFEHVGGRWVYVSGEVVD